MLKNEEKLSNFASKSEEAIRFKQLEEDIRPAYFRDVDKIIYSLSYTRYIDKTQVFSNNDNDNISKRMTHVQMVSKIARTIGRALNLNEDLIEAASLGHDLGHVPFGHTGEAILSKISMEHNEGYFNHNIQSVRTLMYVENKGKGVNISLQVLDAIMCHNGEIVESNYMPSPKTKEEFLEEYNSSYKDKTVNLKMRPMTLEGCVVRISDVIAYIGRDIEDAIRVGVIKKEALPKEIIEVLGNSNSDIINTMVLDIIENSYNKPYIKMSPKIYVALEKLKKFNYENIYNKANTKEQLKIYEKQFRFLFETYLKQIEEKQDEKIFKVFLNEMDKEYLEKTSNERKVIDYIAGMTDDYFLNEYKRLIDKK
ncbi:MAG: HD domain-containing protein [Bacilli bacterium]|nr:HD domain-containing protein [Bacilli bacterium]